MMNTTRRTRGAVAVAFCLTLAAAARAEEPVPLAVVNGDTLTTTELAGELGVMFSRAPEDARFEAPEPERVLRRMIQNELVIQEGYRMGLDQQFTVRNPRSEAVRNRCVRALLDSVAALVPQGDLDEAAWIERRRERVQAYLAELMRTQQVQVDTTLLESLDYGSADPEVQKRLRDSGQVIALLANGDITVAELSREIRFVAFHGLEGKPDAAQRRDKIFWDNVHERVVAHEAKRRGLDLRPDMVAFASSVERSLVLEEALGILVKFDFAPADAEVRAFYEAHLDAVTPAPRIRMESVKLNSEEEAKALRERALQGAKLAWLARNMPGVIDGPPPFPETFFPPQQLGIAPEDAVQGLIPEPYGVPGGWVVARVVEVEPVVPRPLDDCRTDILKMMHEDAVKEHMTDVMARLEAVAEVTVLPGAQEETAKATAALVALRDEELAARAAAPDASAGPQPAN